MNGWAARHTATDEPIERPPIGSRDVVVRIRLITEDVPERVLGLDSLPSSAPWGSRPRP